MHPLSPLSLLAMLLGGFGSAAADVSTPPPILAPARLLSPAPAPLPSPTSARRASRVSTPRPSHATAQRQAIARGTVVDQDGDPIAGVSVIIEEWYLGTRLDIGATAAGDREAFAETRTKRSMYDIESGEDGSFSHPGLLPNVEYRLRLEKEGYIPLEMKKVFRVAVNELGTFRLVSGNVEEARAAYDRGYEAYRQRRFAEAIAAMQEVVSVYGDSDSSDQMLVVALAVLGQSHLHMQQFAEAERALVRVAAITPDSATVQLGLGRLRANQGRMDEAVGHFEKAIEVEPDNPNGHFYLGSLRQMTGSSSEAIAPLVRCLELEPGFAQAHSYLGQAYAQTGQNDEAIEHLEAYLEAAPNAPDAAQVRALLERLKG